MTLFADQFRNYAQPALDKQFGESIEIVGLDRPRTIRARLRITALDSMGQMVDENTEHVILHVTRDQFGDLAGIPAPVTGMKFRRNRETDADGWFVWTNEIIHQTDTSLSLRFSRPKPFRVGKR